MSCAWPQLCFQLLSKLCQAAATILGCSSWLAMLLQTCHLGSLESVWSRDTDVAQAGQAGAEQGVHSSDMTPLLCRPRLDATSMAAGLQVSSACACERNWSTYDYIHNKRRNCLSTSQCRRLVYFFTNRYVSAPEQLTVEAPAVLRSHCMHAGACATRLLTSHKQLMCLGSGRPL